MPIAPIRPRTDPRIRPARPGDVDRIVSMVYELAEYEKAPEQCRLSAEQLHTALFTGDPSVMVHVVAPEPFGASDGRPDPEPVGFALSFLTYSTWEGVHGLHLEDLYVQPEHRGTGLGKALLTTLAGIAAANSYARVEWAVLDWNTPSIEFYRAMGAEPMDEWTTFRLSGRALARTAAGTA